MVGWWGAGVQGLEVLRGGDHRISPQDPAAVSDQPDQDPIPINPQNPAMITITYGLRVTVAHTPPTNTTHRTTVNHRRVGGCVRDMSRGPLVFGAAGEVIFTEPHHLIMFAAQFRLDAHDGPLPDTGRRGNSLGE